MCRVSQKCFQGAGTACQTGVPRGLVQGVRAGTAPPQETTWYWWTAVCIHQVYVPTVDVGTNPMPGSRNQIVDAFGINPGSVSRNSQSTCRADHASALAGIANNQSPISIWDGVVLSAGG